MRRSEIGLVIAISAVLGLIVFDETKKSGAIIDRWPLAPIQIFGMEHAILMFQVDHGRLPIVSNASDEQDGHARMVLMGGVPDGHSTNLGKTNLAYFEFSPEILAAGKLLDPWGHPYHIAFDVTQHGTVTIGQKHLATNIAIWSDGPNGINEYGEGDDLSNWKPRKRSGR
jgi:hypothetical protein